MAYHGLWDFYWVSKSCISSTNAMDGPLKEVDTLTIYMIIAAVVGARLGHVLFYDPVEFFNDPISIFAVWEGGLASHGAGIGLFIALYFFARKAKIHYLWIVDRLVIIYGVDRMPNPPWGT